METQKDKVNVDVYKTPNGFCAGIDILPGWAATSEGDFSQLQKMIKEGIDFYIECAKVDGDYYPPVFDRDYTFEYKFDIESLLSFSKGILTLSGLARLTKINEKQLSHYQNGRSKPRPATAKKIVDAFHNLGKDLLAVSV